ncbi:hypothetical protein [Ktedonobacter sp. SOSP1-52]|uniref:hypothetical protein n=1 Tax=Ktedonobacter sp. SOSP1-52 TaxID=2778366 RepID=UPI001F422E63|nr:hypothetical protein [Ktedonobacter sp. SOSP1-52]
MIRTAAAEIAIPSGDSSGRERSTRPRTEVKRHNSARALVEARDEDAQHIEQAEHRAAWVVFELHGDRYSLFLQQFMDVT